MNNNSLKIYIFITYKYNSYESRFAFKKPNSLIKYNAIEFLIALS